MSETFIHLDNTGSGAGEKHSNNAQGDATGVIPVTEYKGVGSLNQFPTVDIAPIPSEILRLPYERAELLATKPRSKWTEFGWASVSGLVGSLPSAAEAIRNAFFVRQQPGLTWFETIEVCFSAIFITLTFTALFQSMGKNQTSTEYLKELIKSKQ